MPFDMSLFYLRQTLWPSLKWLGHQDWLKVISLLGFTSRLEVNPRILRDPQARHHQELLSAIFVKSGELSPRHRGDFFTSLVIGSRAVAIGPKVFGPAMETCVALEQVDLNFPWSELRLPFPSLVLDYSKAWVGRMTQAYGLRQTPVASMIGHISPDQIHLWIRNAEGGESHSIITNRPEHRTVDDIFGAHEGHGRRTAALTEAITVSHGE
jgi:hypothetical protein